MSIKQQEIKALLQKLDTTFIQDNLEFVTACNNVKWDDINTLNLVLQHIDKLIQKYPTPNDTIKEVLTAIPNLFVTKYPFLFGYWKKITAIEYQLYGLEKSVEALATSVKKFPQSLELWCDYFKVLIANYPKDVERIRSLFKHAKDLIGWQFYAHVFWDLYITFETKQGSELKGLYAEIIELPLHQYAKYVKPYKALLKDPKDIASLHSKVKSNQTIVGEIWKYESKIKQNFFNLTPLPKTEVDNWEQYTTFVINSKKDTRLVRSIFERALIPCCFIEELWIKYIDWFQTSHTQDQTIELYKSGTSKLPVAKRKLRFNFLNYLKSELVKTEDRVSLFDMYSKECVLLMSNYNKEKSTSCNLLSQYFPVLKSTKFNSSLSDSSKIILSKQTEYSKYLDTSITSYLSSKPASNDLGHLLCEGNLAIIVVELIKVTWLVVKNNVQTRKYFNFFGKLPSVRNSVSFWLTYYKFEKASKNFVKLNKFISDLGMEIYLPMDVINDILEDYKTFYLLNSNVIEFRQHEDKSDKFQYVDPLLYSQFKINKPKWTPGKLKKISSSEWYKSSEYRENGHPGILVERPQIKNSIINYSSKVLKNKVPGIPIFRNLERMNQTPKYRDYYTDEFLSSQDRKK
ncbi:pre-mRNA-processing factor 39 [Monosporozyma unispora]|nr:hypothetical protein C6P44_000681 [Kazachstania unispora]